jgi:hypothetical protein
MKRLIGLVLAVALMPSSSFAELSVESHASRPNSNALSSLPYLLVRSELASSASSLQINELDSINASLAQQGDSVTFGQVVSSYAKKHKKHGRKKTDTADMSPDNVFNGIMTCMLLADFAGAIALGFMLGDSHGYKKGFNAGVASVAEPEIGVTAESNDEKCEEETGMLIERVNSKINAPAVPSQDATAAG